MKLLIDIPKEKYEWIKTHNLNIDNDSIVGAVANGIPYVERPQGKWIPTSEFSPEEYDSYLVMWRFMAGEYDGKLFYEICEYDPDEDEWERIEQAGEAGAEIVAWMPLPERYEPKKDDEDKE